MRVVVESSNESRRGVTRRELYLGEKNDDTESFIKYSSSVLYSSRVPQDCARRHRAMYMITSVFCAASLFKVKEVTEKKINNSDE